MSGRELDAFVDVQETSHVPVGSLLLLVADPPSEAKGDSPLDRCSGRRADESGIVASLAYALSRYCYLSDATLVRGAVVRSRLSLAASIALWRTLPRQSGAIRWARLHSDGVLEDEVEEIRNPLLASLVACMDCELVTAFRFSHQAHVNVQEAVALRTAVKSACRDSSLCGTRVSFLVDSLVVQSTWCWGRSSSHQLNRIQQMTLPYILGAGIVPMIGWIPSACNPADDPTRGVELRSARPVGDDLAAHLEAIPWSEPRPWNSTKVNWQRRDWATGEAEGTPAVSIPDTEFVDSCFDDTRGYPGEGPKISVGQIKHDNDLTVTVQPGTLRRYDACLVRLRTWMATERLGSLESFLADPTALNGVLRAYVQHLYNQSSPVSWSAETLAAIQCLKPGTRGHLGPSWLMQRQFARTRPLSMRPPMPLELLLAVAMTLWLHGQFRSAVGIMIGYHCLLRPSELCHLRRSDLLLSCDTSGAEWSGVLAIGQSKTMGRSARLQSVLVGDDAPSRLLVPGGLLRLNHLFDGARQLLGVPQGMFTLGGLRAGGAVDFLRATNDPHSLQYRGRWESSRSMYHYMQIGAGMSTYARLPEPVQLRLRALAHLAPTIFNLAVACDRRALLSPGPNEDQ
eukprot:5235579-Amphidinium_carterae.1